jgi:hypothetical protein
LHVIHILQQPAASNGSTAPRCAHKACWCCCRLASTAGISSGPLTRGLHPTATCSQQTTENKHQRHPRLAAVIEGPPALRASAADH